MIKINRTPNTTLFILRVFFVLNNKYLKIITINLDKINYKYNY
jgi:hypothetical protein